MLNDFDFLTFCLMFRCRCHDDDDDGNKFYGVRKEIEAIFLEIDRINKLIIIQCYRSCGKKRTWNFVFVYN